MAHSLLHAAADRDPALDLDGLMKSFVALALLISLVVVWGISRSPERTSLEASITATSELSPEWLWKKSPENFDQMFRQVH